VPAVLFAQDGQHGLDHAQRTEETDLELRFHFVRIRFPDRTDTSA